MPVQAMPCRDVLIPPPNELDLIQLAIDGLWGFLETQFVLRLLGIELQGEAAVAMRLRC
jgi:hypothetical protein